MSRQPNQPHDLDALAKPAANPRIHVRRNGPPRPDGKCVVYWMQRAMRIHENAALDVAIDVANLLGLPVVVFFSVIANYPNANLRHYHFLQQGLRDVEEDAKERGVGFILRRHPDNSLETFLEEVDAALLIGDENPCREPERWRKVLARRLKLPYWTVDADVVVPSAVFGRDYFLLQHMRPHLKAALPRFLIAPHNPEPQHAWHKPKSLASDSLAHDITAGFNDLDRTIQPVDTFTGGTHAALKRLNHFIAHGLKDYSDKRNHPEVQGTSRLSPWLHFGNIGPLTIALAVDEPSPKATSPRPRATASLSRSSPGANYPSSSSGTTPTTTAGNAPNPGRARPSSSTPPTSALTATPSSNWNAPKPTTTSGTPPSAR